MSHGKVPDLNAAFQWNHVNAIIYGMYILSIPFSILQTLVPHFFYNLPFWSD